MMNKISKARAGLVLENPFFGTLALKLKIVEDPGCETAWTDGENMGYSPKFLQSLNLEKTKGLIAHEIMHCACAHHLRRGERDSSKWNIAGDYVINAVLVESGFALPDNGLIDLSCKDKSTDHVYANLPKQVEGTSGEADPGGCGEVRDATNPKTGKRFSPSQVAQAEEDWKAAVAQAVQQAKKAGKLPASLERLMGEILAPKINWRQELRRFVQQATKNDYSWTRPNKRYVHQGLYLPSLYSEEMGNIVLVMDTSGSISDDEINGFAAEMTAILEDCRPETLRVIYCDSAVVNTEFFFPDDPVILNPKGGGGTSFVPPFEWVAQESIAPVCLIYLTDGYCSDFPLKPDYPTIWVVTENKNFLPAFGETIRL